MTNEHVAEPTHTFTEEYRTQVMSTTMDPASIPPPAAIFQPAPAPAPAASAGSDAAAPASSPTAQTSSE